MRKIGKMFCQMLQGVDGITSSKRVITFVAFICVATAFLLNVFMHIHLEEHVFDGMLYLVMAGLGFSSFEKFSPKHAHIIHPDPIPREPAPEYIHKDPEAGGL